MSKLTANAEKLKIQLKEIFEKKKLLKSIERQIADARYAYGVTAINYATPSVQGGLRKPQQERFIERIDNLVQRYNAVMEEVFKAEDDFSGAIKDLPAIEQSILIDRYINGKTWRVISIHYHYGKNQPHRIEVQALNKIAESGR